MMELSVVFCFCYSVESAKDGSKKEEVPVVLGLVKFDVLLLCVYPAAVVAN